ncbi:Major facilitator superfamily MFS-1 domain containing protein, protein [Aphelenchoides fujianensis]|nr:Major facilitator superfamily MFS-1 domain containing protein, protein [Aphelenchoides fujianensis]
MSLLFTPFGWPGVRIVGRLFASTFTAPAAFACVINVAGLVCSFVFFKERYAGLVDESKQQTSGHEKPRVLPRYDLVAVLIVHLVTFSQRFSFTNLETLSGPLGTSMFSWTREEITRNIAFAHGAVSLCTLLVNLLYFFVRNMEKM